MVFVDQKKPWYMCILLLEMRRISCEKELIFKIRVDVSAVDFYINEPQDNSFKEISNLKYHYKSKIIINYIFRCNIQRYHGLFLAHKGNVVFFEDCACY